MTGALIVPSAIASDLEAGSRREWLETNGLGSFAMGTISGAATRRYHAILCAATRPPSSRMVLVNSLAETVVVDGSAFELSTNFYPGVVHPEGYRAIIGFRLDPWPIWTMRIGGTVIERSIFMPHGRQMTVVTWRLVESAGSGRARLFVKPMISGRDYHGLHHENDRLERHSEAGEGLVVLRPYPEVPATYLHHNGMFLAKPDWYRHFEYPAERERGLEFDEDLFTPGEVQLDLVTDTDAVVIFSLEPPGEALRVSELRHAERERRSALSAGANSDVEHTLRLAAEKFVVRRGEHRTIVAGYPWFTDWGRDTFIALPGLSLATGWMQLGRELLLAWAPHVQGGLIPNRFPDGPGALEYNSVDAPLWYVVAADRWVKACKGPLGDEDAATVARLLPAVRAIIDGYLDGTQLGIGVDDDGLVHAAAAGCALTWMDAKVGDWVVTPRQGKPVEIQALWVAALEAGARLFTTDDVEYARELQERAAWARSSFAATFWDEQHGWLYDVVDGPRRDSTLRPNQLYALGLTAPLIDAERAERVLAVCERELVTPVGLRTRARDEGYRGRSAGDVRARDGAYHQGTIWPFLLGIYADACHRVRGRVPAGLLDGLRAHLAGPGVGQLAEIFDGEPPHEARGCPAQAWSVAEALRIIATYGL
ncbi:MAG: putative Glycogen debranching enzyme [Myxococcales bacterium]|nr:putative Glycogen debranching enzyme [Myxococcales bacterium]